MNKLIIKIFVLVVTITFLATPMFGIETYDEAIKAARVKIQKRNYVAARQILKTALELKNLTPIQTYYLKIDYARSYEKEKNPQTAMLEYEKILKDSKLKDNQRIQVLTYVACSASEIMKTEKVNNAIIAIKKLPISNNSIKALGTIALKISRSNFPAADKILQNLLKKVEKNDKQKLLVLQNILNLYFRRSTYKLYRPIMVEYLKLAESKKLKPYLWTLNQFANRAISASDFKIAQQCYIKIIETAPLHPHYSGAYFGAAEIAMINGDKAKAKKYLQDIIGNPKYKVSLRYVARVMQLAIESKNSKIFRTNLPKADKEFASENFSEEERFKLLRQASNYLFIAYYYDYVRALVAETNAMMRPENKKTFICRYVKNAPRSADSWARSPLLKDSRLKDSQFVKYAYLNDNLRGDIAHLKSSKLLDGPVNKKGYDTSAYIVYDESGIHIYAKCDDPDAQKIAQGFMKGGTIEMYLQPGKDHAYHQWFFDLPGTDEHNLVNWDSPNKHYRNTYDYLEKDASINGNAIGGYTFIPWLMVYDKMPSKSNKWIFGMQRWTKGGSVTLGGAVHELGRGVSLEFDMSKKQRLSIQRDIIDRAFAKYKTECKKREGISLWNDPVLGDVQFYKSAVKPLLDKLDKAGEKVNDKMSNSDIELLFTEYVPQWLEVKYEVAELRTTYLTDKLLK